MKNIQTNIQKYIQDRLLNLNTIEKITIKTDLLPDYIYHKLMTRRYRKYAVTQEYQEHIKKVIINSISDNRPIPLVWVFGCYKLFRLKESPNPDWAELFSLIYFSEWLKPIATVYKPGVVFDFFADGIIVPLMNNIPETDLKLYKHDFKILLSFIKQYLPSNLKFQIHTLHNLYGTKSAFLKELHEKHKIVLKSYKTNPYTVSPEQKKVIQLNVKFNNTIKNNEYDIQKIQLLFDAFSTVSKRRPYYRNPDKIMLDSLNTKNTLPIGTNKSSIVRFWVGIGVLKQDKNSFIDKILSFSQIKKYQFKEIPIKINTLDLKNFKKIKLIL